MKKRMIVNLGLVLLFTLLSIYLYNSGKGYDLLLDNQTVTINGVTYEAEGTARVIINDGEPVELWEGDRGIATVRGKIHRIKVEMLDEDEEQVLSSVEKDFSIDTKKGTLFSIPAILGGASEWVISR